MFSIFKKQKKNEEQVDDPGVQVPSASSTSTCSNPPDLKDIQCTKNTVIHDLADLGDRESGPRLPQLAAYKKIKFGEKFRSFRSQWYTECEWLEYSVQRNAAFCFVCRVFGPENSEDAWIRTGFSNWQKNFKAFIKKKINLTSWKVQDELIKISADLVTETIVGDILETGHFALMVDEARSHKQEQLSVCVRYTVGLEIYERFLQFVNVSCDQDANQIISAIYSSFKNCNLNMDALNIVAQSYDGACVMSGHIGGVQAKIKEHYPCAIYTHCMAHRLNLVVVDLWLKKGSILRVCNTRWVCRFKNCEAMIRNYTAIIEYLSNEIEEQSDKDVVEAIGILSEVQKCTFLIGVLLLKDVLGIINILSTTLQSKTGTLACHSARHFCPSTYTSFFSTSTCLLQTMSRPSPPATRSGSTASATSKKCTSNDDILKAIEHIQSSQDKLLAGHKSLGSDLKTSINALTSRFDSLSLEISELRTKVDLLESKVLALESKTSNLSTVSSTQISDVIQEFTERDRCKLNIIMYGLPESTSSDLPTKINDDKVSVRGIFSKLSTDLNSDFKSFRLGKPTSTSTRPLKVIFSSCEAASAVLTSYRQAKIQNLSLLPLTSIVRDKTLLERQQLRTCHLELDRRVAAGENNLTITFKNGSPCVISRSKNDIRVQHHPQQ
ncbi:hypothetical protein QTP88_003831 [Uroleucon formosanum]